MPQHICEVRNVDLWGSLEASWLFPESLTLLYHVCLPPLKQPQKYLLLSHDRNENGSAERNFTSSFSLSSLYEKLYRRNRNIKRQSSQEWTGWPGTPHILPVTKFRTLCWFFWSPVLSTKDEWGPYTEALESVLSVSLTSSKLKILWNMLPFHVFFSLNSHSFLCFSPLWSLAVGYDFYS